MDEQDDRLPLYRRKVFDADLGAYVASSRTDDPVALVILDLDRFKTINDTHGHPVGDELLADVARCTNAVVGSKGRAYRYGGEEVTILLQNYSAEEALALAERLRRTLEEGTWTSKRIEVTASFGVAVAPLQTSDAADLLRLADAALYEAKKLGRNYVRLSGEPRPAAPLPRQPERREPPPGGVSETQMEDLRVQYYKHGRALCLTDGVPLKVQEGTGYGVRSPRLYMKCPVCEFNVDIPAIPVAKR